MKKILSLSLVALFAVSALAQQQLAKPAVDSAVRSAMRAKMAKDASYSEFVSYQEDGVPAKAPRRAKVAAKEDTLVWLRDYGTFFFDGSYPILVVDTLDFAFYSASAMHTNDSLYWGLIINETLYNISDSANQRVLSSYPSVFEDEYIPSGYTVPLPILLTADTAGSIQKTYSWGSGLKERYLEYAELYPQYAEAYTQMAAYADPIVLSKPSYPVMMTTCAMYTDSTNGIFDTYRVGAGNYGPYAYGTGLNIPLTATKSVLVDTFLVIFDNLSNLWMDTATLELYSSVETMIAAGGDVKLEIVKADLKNNRWQIGKDVIATAVATQSDLKNVGQYSNGGGYYGTLEFAFGSKNALGGFTPAPITISGMFAIRVILNNAAGNNFGVYSDYVYPDGQTYFYCNGSLYGWSSGNMQLSLHAQFVDEPAQGVENTSDDVKPVKVIRDGQILIQKGEKTFTVMGTEF